MSFPTDTIFDTTDSNQKTTSIRLFDAGSITWSAKPETRIFPYSFLVRHIPLRQASDHLRAVNGTEEVPERISFHQSSAE